MNLRINGFSMILDFYIRKPGMITKIIPLKNEQGIYTFDEDGVVFSFSIDKEFNYKLTLESKDPASVKISLTLPGEEDLYHLIPCNIHGDNNLENAKPGIFPNLTFRFPEYKSSSPEWEFRADRASHPVSIISCSKGAVGISINPYSPDSQDKTKFIRNGVFSSLPETAGVSLGYKNYPCTFTSKEMMTDPTGNYTLGSFAAGKIYAVSGNRSDSCYKIVHSIYYNLRECPKPLLKTGDYLDGFLYSYENINWSDDMQSFTNEECSLPDKPDLKPWRPLIAIGWTGTAVIAYPMLCAQILKSIKTDFTKTLTSLFDTISKKTNHSTGFLYDLTRPRLGSDVNGWWAGYMVKDCHCAYTNGNGVYYMLKTYELLKQYTGITNKHWLDAAKKAVDAAISLQDENGNYGYTFSTEKPEVIDKNGFAGCWFAAAGALLLKLTGNRKYLESSEMAMDFYFEFVKNLDCWGTPMDTWKSIDQEGNLAFIRAAGILHEYTGNPKYLEMMKLGAGYEYLWRYSFRAKPEFPPLKDSPWNSCGGSVTSVSNPHIHPMGRSSCSREMAWRSTASRPSLAT